MRNSGRLVPHELCLACEWHRMAVSRLIFTALVTLESTHRYLLSITGKTDLMGNSSQMLSASIPILFPVLSHQEWVYSKFNPVQIDKNASMFKSVKNSSTFLKNLTHICQNINFTFKSRAYKARISALLAAHAWWWHFHVTCFIIQLP